MPGHVKKGGKHEQDPGKTSALKILLSSKSLQTQVRGSSSPMSWRGRTCSSPMVSLHQAFKLGHAPAFPDAKKSVWVPDGEGGFDEALIDNIEGDKVNLGT